MEKGQAEHDEVLPHSIAPHTANTQGTQGTQRSIPDLKFTPEELKPVLDSQQLDWVAHTQPQGLSQGDLLMMTQGDAELQQEMRRAERASMEREQSRAHEAKAALRGAAADLGSMDGCGPGLGVHNQPTAEVSMMPVNDVNVAAASGGAGADQLATLAQAAAFNAQGPTDLMDPAQQLYMQQPYTDNAAWAAAYAANMPAWGSSALLPGTAAPYWGAQQGQYTQRHRSLSKPEHATSTAKRRGPMDEMRQLQRILTKLLPGSIIYMPNQDGGGNKVQADDIKVYLAATLGEAPKPDWGLKNGWGQYLADLFNWATGREGKEDEITQQDAMACARRPQGRSWEVVYDKLMELGIYSWNWELPLRQEQVLNCQHTPPPELTRQQEALAAATAAAAAAAAVTAGTAPDAIPSLPVVARMASLLGKRQQQQVAPMQTGPMGTPPLMLAQAAGESQGADVGPAASVAGGVAASAQPAASDERAPKKQRSSTGGPAATPAPADAAEVAAPAAADSTAVAAAPAAGAAAGSESEAAPHSLEWLQAMDVQQLLGYLDNRLSNALQVLQTKVMSGTAVFPSMDYFMQIKNFKLDPLYAALIALTQQGIEGQTRAEQHMAQQAAMLQQQAREASISKAEPAAAAAAVQSIASAASTGGAASSGATEPAAPNPGAAAATSDAQGERDTDAALGRPAAAGTAAASAAPRAAAAMAAKALKEAHKKAPRGGRASQPDPAQAAQRQSAVQAAAAEAEAAAASWRQKQQQQHASEARSAALAGAAAALRAGCSKASRLQQDTTVDSMEDAALAAQALTQLAGSPQEDLQDGMAQEQYQQQYQPQRGAVQKRRVGNSRLANGSS